MNKFLNVLFFLMTVNLPVYALALPKDIQKFYLTGSCINCDLSGDAFLNTEHPGSLNLNGANLINSGISLSGSFNRRYSNFQNILGLNFNIMSGDFSYSNFSYANLKKSGLIGMNLTGSDFTGTNLTGANLTESNLYQSNISMEQLKSVGVFCNTILPNGNLTDCN